MRRYRSKMTHDCNVTLHLDWLIGENKWRSLFSCNNVTQCFSFCWKYHCLIQSQVIYSTDIQWMKWIWAIHELPTPSAHSIWSWQVTFRMRHTWGNDIINLCKVNVIKRLTSIPRRQLPKFSAMSKFDSYIQGSYRNNHCTIDMQILLKCSEGSILTTVPSWKWLQVQIVSLTVSIHRRRRFGVGGLNVGMISQQEINVARYYFSKV